MLVSVLGRVRPDRGIMASSFRSTSPFVLLALAVAAGCTTAVVSGGSGGTHGGTGGAPTATGGAGGATASSSGVAGSGGGTLSGVDGGACGLPEWNGPGPAPKCMGQDLCPAVQIAFTGCGTSCALPVFCQGVWGDGSACAAAHLVDAAAAKCVLQKLHDHEVGLVTVGWNNDNGFCGQGRAYYSFGDGTVGISGGAYYGQAGECAYAPSRSKLRATSWFDACLAATDEQTLISCVTNLTACEVADGPACPP
jgi:hypothetical protein